MVSEDGLFIAAEDDPELDNKAVDAFAVALKDKLAKARAKGRSGWQDCPSSSAFHDPEGSWALFKEAQDEIGTLKARITELETKQRLKMEISDKKLTRAAELLVDHAQELRRSFCACGSALPPDIEAECQELANLADMLGNVGTYVGDLQARIAELEKEREWRPITTKPSDGTPFIGLVKDRDTGRDFVDVFRWWGGDNVRHQFVYAFPDDGEIIGWKPLPSVEGV